MNVFLKAIGTILLFIAICVSGFWMAIVLLSVSKDGSAFFELSKQLTYVFLEFYGLFLLFKDSPKKMITVLIIASAVLLFVIASAMNYHW